VRAVIEMARAQLEECRRSDAAWHRSQAAAVGAGEREPGLAVVERGGAPTRGRVAGFAPVAEPAVVRVVGAVAGDAAHRRPGETPAGMASGAGRDAGVRAGERKPCQAVIEAGSDDRPPVGGRVAGLTLGAEAARASSCGIDALPRHAAVWPPTHWLRHLGEHQRARPGQVVIQLDAPASGEWQPQRC
jgi:hypothetical protein